MPYSESESEEEEEAPPPPKKKTPAPTPSTPKDKKTTNGTAVLPVAPATSAAPVTPVTVSPYCGAAKAALKRSSEEEEEDEEILAEPPPTPKPAEAKEIEAQAGDIDSTSPDTPSYELGWSLNCKFPTEFEYTAGFFSVKGPVVLSVWILPR